MPKPTPFTNWQKSWTQDHWTAECKLNWNNNWKEMIGRLRAFLQDHSQANLGNIKRADIQIAMQGATLAEAACYKANGEKQISQRLQRVAQNEAHARSAQSQRLRKLS